MTSIGVMDGKTGRAGHFIVVWGRLLLRSPSKL